jgi:hypothetical protein
MEFRGQAEVASKLLMEGRATISPASVHGHDAYVVSGEHELDLLDDGQLLRFTSRGLAVLWSDGTVTLRLETGLPRAAALALADGTS